MGRKSLNRTITVDADVSIDEFDDDVIVDEVGRRNLVKDVLEAAGRLQSGTEDATPALPREIAQNVCGHIMCRRIDQAREEMDRLLSTFVPPQILAALDALRAGDASLALCELDSYIEPPLSARITDVEFAIYLNAAKRHPSTGPILAAGSPEESREEQVT